MVSQGVSLDSAVATKGHEELARSSRWVTCVRLSDVGIQPQCPSVVGGQTAKMLLKVSWLEAEDITAIGH